VDVAAQPGILEQFEPASGHHLTKAHRRPRQPVQVHDRIDGDQFLQLNHMDVRLFQGGQQLVELDRPQIELRLHIIGIDLHLPEISFQIDQQLLNLLVLARGFVRLGDFKADKHTDHDDHKVQKNRHPVLIPHIVGHSP